jgi:hypothetical protein
MTLLLALACSGNIEPANPYTDDTDGYTGGPDDVDGDGYLASEDDCDDNNPDVNPGRSEGCDGLDNDCNGEIDDDPVDAATFYADDDGDGWGDVNNTLRACEAPDGGWLETSGDCDDGNADINPDGQEVCDATYEDEDCDGNADDSDDSVDPAGFLTLYQDSDGDGYGNAAVEDAACHEGSGWVTDDTDCDDTDGQLTPENECDLGWYGTYTGDFTYNGTADLGSDSCTATGVDVVIDPLLSNQVTSSFTCTWSGLLGSIIGAQSVTFEGVINSDDTVTGGFFVGTLYVDEYDAAMTESGTFAGTFEGSDSSSGFDIVYDGDFSFTR